MNAGPTAKLSAAEITAVVQRLADEISAEHPGGLVMVGVLKGSVFLVADLVRALSVPCTVDFLALSSYAPGERRVRILKDLDQDVDGEDIVVAADVVDTGLSMAYVVDLLEARRARTVRVCALFDRPARRILPVPIAYLGAEVAEDFLVGYGLDLAERYRNLPCAYAIDPRVMVPGREAFEAAVYGPGGASSGSGARD